MPKSEKNTAERHLYEAIRRGNAAAFSKYYEQSLGALVQRVRRTTRDEDSAWCIAQDTFAKLWEQRERIDPDKSLDGLVSKIAVNAAINARYKKLVHERFCDETSFLKTDEAAAAADAGLLEEEMRLRIASQIEKMPPQRRRIFKMSRNKNLTYGQIAERLGLSVETVRTHMRLALGELRDVISITSAILFLFRA